MQIQTLAAHEKRANLHHAGMSSGQEIGVIGVGGLGHMAVQFASKLGNRVTVFTTSDDKAEFATRTS